MGYRCPYCKKDFGLGEEGKLNFQKHLQDNVECNVEAWTYTTLFERILDRQKTKENPPKKKNTYSKIGPHNWVKQNLTTLKDGWDIVVCSKCGLKAKRRLDQFKFDMRQIKKIENCVNE